MMFFTVSHKWLAAFRDELSQREFRLPFECITRADRLNEEVLAMLRECGCRRIWIGAESGSQRILDAMDRRVDARKVQDMIIAARQYGIETGTFIMLGYPGEEESDILQTLEHLKRANPDLFTITVAYPIKGTSLYQEVANRLKTVPDWNNSTDRDLDFWRTYSRPYYDFAVRWVVNSLHLHKKKKAGQLLSFSAFKLWVKTTVARLGMRWYRLISPNGPDDGLSSKLSKTTESLLPDTAGE